MRLFPVISVLATCCLCACRADYNKGVVSLDTLTFDKVLSKFKVSVVKFDVSYPYGEKHEEFIKLGLIHQSVDDLLVAQIPVKDYGDKDNEDLAVRFGVSKSDFPIVKVFVDGHPNPYTFDGDEFDLNHLQKFVRECAKGVLYIGLPGTIEEFDRLAGAFAAEKSTDARKVILLDAENLWDKTDGKQKQKSAEIYVKNMRKALEKGDGFFGAEIARINNILKGGSMTEGKKTELGVRLNVLESFNKPRHDEL